MGDIKLKVRKVIQQSPLSIFFVLTFLFTWSLLPFSSKSIAVSLIALCGPAAAAFIVISFYGGVEKEKFYRRLTEWQIHFGWYLTTVILPLPISILRSSFELLLGTGGSIEFQSISVLSIVVFILIMGEEIGWRGYALPQLLPRFGPWLSSAIVGVVWAFWHLPLFYIEGMPQFENPFPAFIIYTIALSIILTFLYERTKGSVLIAVLFHGAVNTFGFVNTSATPSIRGWTNALCYGVVALFIGLAVWSSHSMKKKKEESMV